MQSTLNEYLASEKFIHDDLVAKAQAAVNHLYVIWKNEGKIEPSLLTWPAEAVVSESGEKIDGVCCMSLPMPAADRTSAIRLMVEKTKAYGLFLVEQVEKNKIRALLETPLGTRCWNIPIMRSGDVDILGAPTVTDNRENVGLLWSPTRASA